MSTSNITSTKYMMFVFCYFLLLKSFVQLFLQLGKYAEHSLALYTLYNLHNFYPVLKYAIIWRYFPGQQEIFTMTPKVPSCSLFLKATFPSHSLVFSKKTILEKIHF